MRRIVFIFTLAFVGLLGFANHVVAQEKDSTEEELRDALEALADLEGLEALKILQDLDLSSLDVADEFLEILEQCREMLEDYEDYQDQLTENSRKDHEISVERLRRRLDDNTYIDDPEKLIIDLTESINNIKKIERSHKATQNSNNPRCCRVIRNLRREMVILVDLVEDYSDQQVETVLGRDEIKIYMIQALSAYAEALSATEEAQLDLDRDREIYMVIPPAPAAPASPAPPGWVFPEWSEHKKGSRGGIGLVRRFEDSINVTSERPVRIVNPAGGVQVSGWNEDYVAATLGIEISANTRSKEKEFAGNTKLSMSSDRDGYLVEARFPELSDPETKILRCLLLVNIPQNLHVVSDNSFGDVYASDLDDGVVVTTRHSLVALENIGGAVEVTNTMGEITISDIRGDVTAKTSYSPITLVGCDGTIEVENAYAEVTLNDTRGPVVIKNSGQITVRDHQGKLTVNNTYGLVQVHDVEGDVFVSNAYQPIEIASIDGSVELDNLFSQIKISDISQSVTASNSHGVIQVDDLEGPVDLSNKNGSITLVLDSDFHGGSSVTISHGTVNLIVDEEPDLKILARVTDGQITSPMTYRVDTKGHATDAEWILGDGGDILRIVGNSSNLVVQDH